MKTYQVTITAKVTKTIQVTAVNEQEAIEMAHGEFTVSSENGEPERYSEETDNVKELG